MIADGLTLWQQLEEDRRLMKRAVAEASDRGRDYAAKKAAYYAAKSSAALRMKADGYPVTLEMDCAEAMWRASLKAIDVYRDDCRIVYDQIKRAQMGDPDF